MKPVVIVTKQEYIKAEETFEESPDFDCIPVSSEEEVLSNAVLDSNAIGVILGVESYSNQLYTVLPKRGIIARFGVGHDGVDKIKASEHSLIVTNTPGTLDDSVAEHAVFSMGVLSRSITIHDRQMKRCKWIPSVGTELKGKTLLILGCGPIGKKTAKIASFGFGMHAMGCDISDLDADQLKKDCGIIQLVKDYKDVLDKVDIISIHLPSLPATRHFVDADFLSKLKTTSLIINTARGPVVDENALYDALKENKIAGAALDVFENEPYEPQAPEKDLRNLENVILTPHIGSSTEAACHRMARSCLKNIKAAVCKEYGRLDIVNPDVLMTLD